MLKVLALVGLVLGGGVACSTTSTGAAPPGTCDLDLGKVDGVQICAKLADHTADSEVTLRWDPTIPSQADRCSKIKVGAKVKWVGDFATYRLFGGGSVSCPGVSAENPIGDYVDNGTLSPMAKGGSVEITFGVAGVIYDYSGDSTHSQMAGQIEVVP